jgi:DNA-directed RNA polymerase specialized sigma24 family protein
MTDQLNERLKQLALEAQKHPFKSRGRQVALQKLWCLIEKSGKLYHPPKSRIPSYLSYEDVYDEALLKLMCHICDKIEEYNPEKSVMAWVNFLFETRFIGDEIRKSTQHIQRQIPRHSWSELDEDIINDLPSPEKLPSRLELIIQCFEEDEGDKFKNKCMTDYPHVNFQEVALLRYRNRYSKKEIAEKFSVCYSSFSSFFDRRLKQFAETIKTFVEDRIEQ